MSARDERQDLFCKGDNDTARDGKEAVSSLRRVVRFERETDLHDTEAEQDKTDGANQSEDEVGQIVYYSQRVIARRKRRHRHGENKCHYHNDSAIGGKPFLNFSF